MGDSAAYRGLIWAAMSYMDKLNRSRSVCTSIWIIMFLFTTLDSNVCYSEDVRL